MTETKSSVHVAGKTIDLPIKKGTMGAEVIDMRSLFAQTGLFSFDPGFISTASCESKITYIDGDAGVLLYRGYPIDQLAEQGDYLEVCYLLLYGELPTRAQKSDFDYRVTHHTMVHEQMVRFFQGFRRDAHPMSIMVASVGALSAFYHDSTNITDPVQRMIASMRLIAKVPTLAAMAYKYSIGQPFVYPRNDLDYTSNFLRMCFAVPTEEYKANPVIARALDRIFILHADLAQVASTSTVRLSGSSGADPFACVAAGIASLSGPAHGGANEAVLKMLAQIGSPERIPHFIARAKNKSDPFRLMGFGHRIYKNYDPRAKIMQRTAREVFSQLERRRSTARRGAGIGAHRFVRRIFRQAETFPQYRFLFGHHPENHGFPHDHVPRVVRGGAHGWVDRPVEGNDRGSRLENGTSQPALYRRRTARLRSDLEALAHARQPAASGRTSIELAREALPAAWAAAQIGHFRVRGGSYRDRPRPGDVQRQPRARRKELKMAISYYDIRVYCVLHGS